MHELMLMNEWTNECQQTDEWMNVNGRMNVNECMDDWLTDIYRETDRNTGSYR